MGDDQPDLLVALGLGLVQGVTEFLPVSSSGHLAAFAMVVSVPEMSLALTVLLHAATLAATVLVFRGDLWDLTRACAGGLREPRGFVRTPEARLLRDLALACVPTAVIGLTMEDRVEAISHHGWIVGAGFLLSAVAVVSTRGRHGGRDELGPRAALLVGLAQGLAVLPGLSRSGTTIACALALGASAPAAFRFSFLVSIPVIAGATVLSLGKPDVLSHMSSTAWLAAAITFVAGYLSLRLLSGLLRRGHFWLFAVYLVPLGAVMVLASLMGDGE